MDSGGLREGDLWAWAEWEPESHLLRRFDVPGTGKPGYLWTPVWSPKQSYRGLHNTDPFVFDGFYYINCKQTLEGLRRLGRGSLIVFGSKKGPHWVVDTVLVVADYVDHTLQDYERLLQGLAPECYWDVTLGPTYKGASASSAGVRRFYRGATYDAPVDGMFSFFPCLPAAQDTPFARPHLELPREHFTQTLAQSPRGYALHADSLAESTVKMLWDFDTGAGSEAGIAARCPCRISCTRYACIGYLLLCGKEVDSAYRHQSPKVRTRHRRRRFCAPRLHVAERRRGAEQAARAATSTRRTGSIPNRRQR